MVTSDNLLLTNTTSYATTVSYPCYLNIISFVNYVAPTQIDLHYPLATGITNYYTLNTTLQSNDAGLN
jgi:hypothetical protein